MSTALIYAHYSAGIIYKTARPSLSDQPSTSGSGSDAGSVSSSGSASGSGSGSGSGTGTVTGTGTGTGSSRTDGKKSPAGGDSSGDAGDASRTAEDEEEADSTSPTEDIPAEDPEHEDGNNMDPAGHTTADTPPRQEEEVTTSTGGRASKRVPKQTKKTKGDDIFDAGDKLTQRYVSICSIIHNLTAFNVSGCAGRAWKKDNPTGTLKQFEAWWKGLDSSVKEVRLCCSSNTSCYYIRPPGVQRYGQERGEYSTSHLWCR